MNRSAVATIETGAELTDSRYNCSIGDGIYIPSPMLQLYLESVSSALSIVATAAKNLTGIYKITCF